MNQAESRSEHALQGLQHPVGLLPPGQWRWAHSSLPSSHSKYFLNAVCSALNPWGHSGGQCEASAPEELFQEVWASVRCQPLWYPPGSQGEHSDPNTKGLRIQKGRPIVSTGHSRCPVREALHYRELVMGSHWGRCFTGWSLGPCRSGGAKCVLTEGACRHVRGWW